MNFARLRWRLPMAAALSGMMLAPLPGHAAETSTPGIHLIGSGSVAIGLGRSAGLVQAVSPELREAFKLSPFYRKHLGIAGFPVVGSSNVSDFALLEAGWIIRQMIGGREDILQALATNRVRLAVMAWNEFTSDVPEHADLKPRVYWDRRARGLGATAARPAVSCAEENLLCYPGDPYATENILIHEFAHTVHEMALKRLDPAFDQRLRTAFQNATSRGLWKGTYAGSNPSEYWAEGVQGWFDNNRENDSLHNHVNTRSELKAYDPELAGLCAEVFGDHPWRYQKPAMREPAGRAHLAGFSSDNTPRFAWREAAMPPPPRASTHHTTDVAIRRMIELEGSWERPTQPALPRSLQPGRDSADENSDLVPDQPQSQPQ
jgi:hypothetical protein